MPVVMHQKRNESPEDREKRALALLPYFWVQARGGKYLCGGDDGHKTGREERLLE